MHYDLMEKNIPSHQNAANLLSSAKLHMQDMYTMQRSAICSNFKNTKNANFWNLNL